MFTDVKVAAKDCKTAESLKATPSGRIW